MTEIETSSILELLSSSNSDDVREGARMAGETLLVEAIPRLIEYLGSRNIGIQEAADRALRKIGGCEVVRATIPLLHSENVPERNLAMDILRNLGSKDIESIIALLHDVDRDIRIFATDILGSVNNIHALPPLSHSLLHDPEVNVRYQAAVSLGSLGFPQAAEALEKALNDEEWVQFSAIEALAELREESSVGALVKALDTSSDLVASTIVDALGEMGNIKAIPLLLKKLESSPAALCNKIVKAVVNILGENTLSLMSSEDKKRLKSCMDIALKDEDIEIQDAAIRGLATLGDDSSTRRIIMIASALELDKDAERIQLIVKSISKIGYVPSLETAIRSGNSVTRWVALSAANLSGPPPSFADLLISEFWNNNLKIQHSMLEILAQLCTKEHQSFFLDVLNKHSDVRILSSALFFLGRNANPADVQEQVMTFLQHPDNKVKETALEACICFNTEEVRSLFCKLVHDEDNINRLMAVYALGHMDASTFESQLLEACSKDSDSDVRKTALEEIGKINPPNEKLLNVIKEKMQDESRDVRMVAAELLGNCPDPSIDGVLVAGTKDEDLWVQVRCVEKLGKRRSESSVGALVEILQSGDTLLKLTVITALGLIGGGDSFRALFDLIEHEKGELQQAAEEAMENIRNRVSGE